MSALFAYARTCPFLLLVSACLLTLSSGQASAQVVQLPTVGFFNVNTVVSVPDGGRSHVAGISGYGGGFSSRATPGLGHLPLANRGFRNQAIGNSNFARNVGVSVKIISLREREAEVMAEAERRQSLRGRSVDPNGSAETRRRAAFINRHIGRKR